MSARSLPPFHADHVGSLLRPKELLDAREQAAAGALDAAGLRKVEDKCIRDAVAMQESIGFKAVTDGEFRRTYWHIDFLMQIEGIQEKTEPGEQPRFKGATWRPTVLEIAGKVRHAKPIMGPDFDFLKSVSTAMPKVCIPAPGVAHFRGGRAAVDRKAYPEMGEFWSDLSAAYRGEVADLARRGCRYLQFDEVFFAYLCDPKLREQVKARGEDPDELAWIYSKAIDDSVRDKPKDMVVTMHVCRGNFQGTWVAEGGYSTVAEAMFSAKVDGFFLEFDDARSGGFEPLALVPKGKIVVLGLVTSKRPDLEAKDELKRRIEEAAKYIPLENLALSPQCGFSSTVHGNPLTQDQQKAKLQLCIEVANEVWGGL
ncbi:MAG: 5-methyltetrahydropteroyltriglutamate--homocysteine S-methyltransferase [Rhodospirillaceae bacterium]|nr:5-methyltetrahydropteroyltriglutamate--homocysteine S-methyltransferase [Rhodospirillaceae bacterium]